jgi:hypothetical protein
MEIDDALAQSVTGDRIFLLHEAATFIVMAKFDILCDDMFGSDVRYYVDRYEDIFDVLIELLSNPAHAGCTAEQAAAFAAVADKHRGHVHDYLWMSVYYDTFEN